MRLRVHDSGDRLDNRVIENPRLEYGKNELMNQANLETSYALARERYASLGVDVDAAIERLRSVAISVNCWQGDDVGGFEHNGSELGSGLAVTGNYPGRARTAVFLPGPRLSARTPHRRTARQDRFQVLLGDLRGEACPTDQQLLRPAR